MLTSLRLGAKVEGADGDNLGTVKFLVANPGTGKVTHFVVEKGFMDTRQVVVPAEDVSNVAEDGKMVHLNISADELGKLPDFIEREYTTSRADAGDPYPGDRPDQPIPVESSSDVYPLETSGYGYVYPLPGVGMNTGNIVFPSGTGMPPEPITGQAVGPAGLPAYTEKMNVPENSLLIRQGAEVRATDGRLGTVKDVNIDSASGRIVSFTVEKGFFFTEDFTVPVEMVSEATEEVVNLNLTRDGVRNNPLNRPDQAGQTYHRASM